MAVLYVPDAKPAVGGCKAKRRSRSTRILLCKFSNALINPFQSQNEASLNGGEGITQSILMKKLSQTKTTVLVIDEQGRAFFEYKRPQQRLFEESAFSFLYPRILHERRRQECTRPLDQVKPRKSFETGLTFHVLPEQNPSDHDERQSLKLPVETHVLCPVAAEQRDQPDLVPNPSPISKVN